MHFLPILPTFCHVSPNPPGPSRRSNQRSGSLRAKSGKVVGTPEVKLNSLLAVSYDGSFSKGSCYNRNLFWVVVSIIFYFQPYLGKISNLTNIFQMGWNHQLVFECWLKNKTVNTYQQLISHPEGVGKAPFFVDTYVNESCIYMEMKWTTSWWFQTFFIFTPKLGEDEPILTSIFFRWVGSTTNQNRLLLGLGMLMYIVNKLSDEFIDS